MNSVATPSRQRAIPARKKPPAQQRHATPESIAAMRSGMHQFDAMVVAAWDSCDETFLADSVLGVVVEHLLPGPMTALLEEPLYQNVAKRAAADLCVVMDLVLVAAKLEDESPTASALTAAANLLGDTVERSLDSAEWMASLPAVQTRDEVLAPSPSSEPARQPEITAFHGLAVDALSRAQTKVQQAMCVLKEYGDSGEPLAALGLIPIVDTLDGKLEVLVKAPDMGTPRSGPLSDASCDLLYAEEIARIVGAHKNDVMLQAVASLLEMAKGIVDDANDTGLTLNREAGHV